MANATGTLSNVAAGAAAGSVVPGWGTAIGAGLGLLSSLLSSDGGAQSQSAQAQEALRGQESRNQYNASLVAEALRRSTAGSSDSFGSTTDYDPYTNTWKSKLGDLPQAAQNALYTSNVQRLGDVRQASYSNEQNQLREAMANRNLSGAANSLANYQDVTPASLRADMDTASLKGNDAVFRPLVADTLRQASRTGTAASPMISDLGRSQAELLSKQLVENSVGSRTQAAGINATNRGALGDTYKTLLGGTQLGRAQAQGPSADPMSSLQSSLAQRIANSQQPLSTAIYSGAGRDTSNLAAAKLGIDSTPGSNFQANKIASIGTQGGNLVDSIMKMYNGSGGTSNFGDYDPNADLRRSTTMARG